MAKLFLHIGFAKTGTTSIQNDMAKNFDALLEQGILYPSDPKAPFMQRVQHLPLVAAIPNHTLRALRPGKQRTLDKAFSSLRSYIAEHSCDTVVLSSEFFGEIEVGVKKIQWIKDQLKDFEVCVVAYIRRQDHHFLSAYQEAIKAGHRGPLNVNSYKSKRGLKFGARLEPWREVFGDENVIVRPFSPKSWPDGELFLDFLQVIGADPDGLELSKPQNESLDYRMVDIFQRLNAMNEGEVRSYFQPVWDPIMFPSALKKQKMQLSYETVEKMRSHFLQDNEKALRSTDISVGDFFPAVNTDQQELITPSAPDTDLLLHIISELPNGKRNRRQRVIEKAATEGGLLWTFLKRAKRVFGL